MLTGGTDAGYRRLLASAYQVITRVEIWRGGARIDPYGDAGVPILASSSPISATLASRVVRTGSFVVQEDRNNILVPESFVDPTALLTPFGSEVRIFQRVRGGAGISFAFQVFSGRIAAISYQASSGQMTVNFEDRAAYVGSSNFGTPQNSDAGLDLVDQFGVLVSGALPSATFGASDPFGLKTPAFNWTNDRASACDDLAGAANAFWYTLANGDFVMRQIPWTNFNAVPVPVTYTDGPGGLINDANLTASRQNVFNQWTVVGELANTSTPFYATASDLNPSSPTYVLGNFGVQGQLQQAQGVSSQGQALSLAQANLSRNKGLTEAWTFSTALDPSLELGDLLPLSVTNQWGVTRTDLQVVSGYTLPITGTSTMQVTCRALTHGLSS